MIDQPLTAEIDSGIELASRNDSISSLVDMVMAESFDHPWLDVKNEFHTLSKDTLADLGVDPDNSGIILVENLAYRARLAREKVASSRTSDG